MFCNGLICLKRNTKWNIFFLTLFCLVLSDKTILVVFWIDAKWLVLNRLLDAFYIFVEENTKLRKVSDTFCVITKTLWTWFVQTEYNSCKIFCKSGVLFAKILQNSNIPCKILQEFVNENAFSCKILQKVLQ